MYGPIGSGKTSLLTVFHQAVYVHPDPQSLKAGPEKPSELLGQERSLILLAATGGTPRIGLCWKS